MARKVWVNHGVISAPIYLTILIFLSVDKNQSLLVWSQKQNNFVIV